MNEAQVTSHIEQIDLAIARFGQLIPVTSLSRGLRYGGKPQRRIGVVTDNTAVFLGAAANALDNGTRKSFIQGHEVWIYIMRAVHCFFLQEILKATEAGFIDICTQDKITIQSSSLRSLQAEIVKIGLPEGQRNKVLHIVRSRYIRPGFKDYLEGILSNHAFSSNRKKRWRSFFRAFVIIRNKASHTDASLTENEKQELIGSGFANFISPKGELHTTPSHYCFISESIILFFDEVSKL